MSYDFSFEKKNAVILTSCVLLIAVLLVLAGFLLGIRSSSSNASASKPQPVPPVQARSVEKPNPLPSPPTPLDVSPSEPLPASAPLQIEKPSPDHSHKSHPSPQFSLQIGAFRSKQNAEARVKILKDQGVAATIMSIRDALGTTWFAVRTGAYSDLPSATKAAQAMSATTNEFVIVRPAQSL
ncbi:SPOR domain-containing protein [Edaphobacter modestus]|uniref:Sporulation related protein n=1 Tax=Edaphobacter modestus TaxID=388466 RepID=A0A4Q7XZB2_9BACT|nr:SPOR domain-containing protein [Edaphobacter modestus]RZU29767.1 sporulation related protein [Edaphobacter modestus]